MSNRLYPSRRDDDADFGPGDELRDELKGKPIAVRGCIDFLKGDWSEYTNTLGMPAHCDSLRPCFACNCSSLNMYDVEGLSMDNAPWRLNGDDDYFAACGACENTPHIDGPAMLEEVVGNTTFDRNRRIGNRVEPSAALPDIGKLENLQPPATTVVWRPACETMTRHRNMVFHPAYSLIPSKCLIIDTLHCIYLGIMQVFCREALWWMIVAGIWGLGSAMDETVAIAVECFRSDLIAFYKVRRRSRRPGESALTETWGVFLCLLHLLHRHRDRLIQGSFSSFVVACGEDT